MAFYIEKGLGNYLVPFLMLTCMLRNHERIFSNQVVLDRFKLSL